MHSARITDWEPIQQERCHEATERNRARVGIFPGERGSSGGSTARVAHADCATCATTRYCSSIVNDASSISWAVLTGRTNIW